MASFGICEVCKLYRAIQWSIIATVSSMGGRKVRRQKSTTAAKVCLGCLQTKGFERHILQEIRQVAKVVRSETRGQMSIEEKYGTIEIAKGARRHGAKT